MTDDRINYALRDHVTRVGFNLSLAKSHVQTLVWLDWRIRHDRGWAKNSRAMNLASGRDTLWGGRDLFAPGVHGLMRRGLVTHTDPDTIRIPKGGSRADIPTRRVWKITRAGRLVINLLRETGIWQEYEATLPRIRDEEENVS